MLPVPLHSLQASWRTGQMPASFLAHLVCLLQVPGVNGRRQISELEIRVRAWQGGMGFGIACSIGDFEV